MRTLPPTHTLCKASACFCGRTGQTRRLQNVWKSRKRGGTIPESFLVRSRPLLTLPGHTLCICHLVMPPPSRMDSAPVHDTTLADCPAPPDTDKPQPTRATSGDTATVSPGSVGDADAAIQARGRLKVDPLAPRGLPAWKPRVTHQDPFSEAGPLTGRGPGRAAWPHLPQPWAHGSFPTKRKEAPPAGLTSRRGRSAGSLPWSVPVLARVSQGSSSLLTFQALCLVPAPLPTGLQALPSRFAGDREGQGFWGHRRSHC